VNDSTENVGLLTHAVVQFVTRSTCAGV